MDCRIIGDDAFRTGLEIRICDNLRVYDRNADETVCLAELEGVSVSISDTAGSKKVCD